MHALSLRWTVAVAVSSWPRGKENQKHHPKKNTPAFVSPRQFPYHAAHSLPKPQTNMALHSIGVFVDAKELVKTGDIGSNIWLHYEGDSSQNELNGTDWTNQLSFLVQGFDIIVWSGYAIKSLKIVDNNLQKSKYDTRYGIVLRGISGDQNLGDSSLIQDVQTQVDGSTSLQPGEIEGVYTTRVGAIIRPAKEDAQENYNVSFQIVDLKKNRIYPEDGSFYTWDPVIRAKSSVRIAQE
jgi:hypothetical protein